MSQPRKPKMTLAGHDGNIFAIMGRANELLKACGQSKQANEMSRRVITSRSYEEALSLISEYVQTELSPPARASKINRDNRSR